MGKVVLYIAQSVDGFIARADGGTAWLDTYQTVDYGYETFIQSVGALIVGGKHLQARAQLGCRRVLWQDGRPRNNSRKGKKNRKEGLSISTRARWRPL